jgi:hypothetical protein
MFPYINQALNTVISGEVQGGTTRAQMPDIPCAMVNIKALTDNAGNVYIGGLGVTVPGTKTNETAGFSLDSGQETGWLPIDNLNKLWMITDANGDDVSYLVLR